MNKIALTLTILLALCFVTNAIDAATSNTQQRLKKILNGQQDQLSAAETVATETEN